MVADGLLTRQRYREVPPRVDYELTERSRDLMPVLGALARWGYDWTWSPPRREEAVDVTAIFRLAGSLVAPAPGRQGTVELRVAGGAAYAVRLTGERVEVEEREAPDAGAAISASVADWVAALQPHGDRSGLVIRGDAGLADAVIEALGGGPQAAGRQGRSIAAA